MNTKTIILICASIANCFFVSLKSDLTRLLLLWTSKFEFWKFPRQSLLMWEAQLRVKPKKSKNVYHLVEVFDPVTKMDSQARFRYYPWSHYLAIERSILKPTKAMKQYINQKDIRTSVRNCIKAMPDNPACYQLVFGDDYFWSWKRDIPK